jgi:hypothetical protein
MQSGLAVMLTRQLTAAAFSVTVDQLTGIRLGHHIAPEPTKRTSSITNLSAGEQLD